MWLGEPTEEVVEHYDAAGNLTGRSVITRPSPWTDEDRGWLLALRAEERETCKGCGHPLDVCRDPRTAGTWTPQTEICQACVIAEAEAENQQEGGRRRGVYIGVARTS